MKLTADLRLCLLNSERPEEVEEYEKAFYQAFTRAEGNLLIRKLWKWDDRRQRLAVSLPYACQQIYILRRESTGQLVTALAVNHNTSLLQSAGYGFSIASPGPDTSEFLTFFSVGEYCMESRFAFWRSVFQDLRCQGITTAYATTAGRILRFYQRMGAEIVKTCEIENEKRYFLRFHTSHTFWGSQHAGIHRTSG